MFGFGLITLYLKRMKLDQKLNRDRLIWFVVSPLKPKRNQIINTANESMKVQLTINYSYSRCKYMVN